MGEAHAISALTGGRVWPEDWRKPEIFMAQCLLRGCATKERTSVADLGLSPKSIPWGRDSAGESCRVRKS